jgi:hypothetical protein
VCLRCAFDERAARRRPAERRGAGAGQIDPSCPGAGIAAEQEPPAAAVVAEARASAARGVDRRRCGRCGRKDRAVQLDASATTAAIAGATGPATAIGATAVADTLTSVATGADEATTTGAFDRELIVLAWCSGRARYAERTGLRSAWPTSGPAALAGFAHREEIPGGVEAAIGNDLKPAATPRLRRRQCHWLPRSPRCRRQHRCRRSRRHHQTRHHHTTPAVASA